MPLPTGTTGGSGRTRSEAAIEAWKHRQRAVPKTTGGLDPKIAARVKEILAAKQKKGKPKGKAKIAAKPKLSDAEKQAAKDQKKAEADKAKAAERGKNLTKVGEDTDLGDHLANLDKFKGGRGLKDKDAAELEKQGLVERGKDGTVRMTGAGNAVLSAAARGDRQGAQDAASRGRDAAAGKQEHATAKADREKASAAKIQERAKKQKAQARATKQKAQARAKIAVEKAKAKAEKEKAKAAAALAKAKPATPSPTATDISRQGAGKAMTDLAIKAGARHSRTDMGHIQAIHDSSVACGADCGNDEASAAMPSDDEEEGVKAIKGIMDDPGYYAQHECQDIMQAAAALSTMTMLIQSELAEEDEDTQHIEMLCDAARTLVDFIDSELDELEQAAKDDASETIGNGPMKAITAREDISPADKKRAVAEYGDVTYADEKNKKYPLSDETKIRAAWSYIGQEKNQAMYSAGEVAAIKNKIVAAWKKLIDKAGPPSAGKAIEIDDTFFAVKSVGDDGIMGPAIRYGTSDEPDMSDKRDYFTKSTNYYLDAWDKRPMLWHHAVPQVDLIDTLRRAGADPEEIKAMRDAIIYLDQNPVIGTWTKAVADPASVWMNGVLDRAHRYRAAIKRMVDLGMLKISTDSIPQMVRREKQSNGTNEVKAWPIVAASLTPQAAEPRLFDVQAIKSIYAEAGIEFPFDLEDETKSDDDRARALLIELELLELEASIAL